MLDRCYLIAYSQFYAVEAWITQHVDPWGFTWTIPANLIYVRPNRAADLMSMWLSLGGRPGWSLDTGDLLFAGVDPCEVQREFRVCRAISSRLSARAHWSHLAVIDCEFACAITLKSFEARFRPILL